MLDATLTFFGLTNPAFSRPPRKPYLDPERRAALSHLQRLVVRRGFAAVTGTPGSGKTALVHYLCGSLNENQNRITYVPFSFLQKGQMLQYLANQLGLEPRRSISATIGIIQKHLHSIQPVNPVIVLDEVQRLETETAHLVRTLMHDRSDTTHHCTVILVGTDSFVEQTLRLQVHEELRQRITLYVNLPPLSREHTGDYIRHHLNAAGCSSDIFEPPALQLIHELVNGVPRLVNALAESAMDQAADQQRQTVSLDNVQAAAEIVLPPNIARMAP